jgi:valyl-tRNA synthetase
MIMALMRCALRWRAARRKTTTSSYNRNFATKLWNACRFAEMNGATTVPDFNPGAVEEVVNQWIISQFSDALGQLEIALNDYRFNDAANRIYQFVWNSYCDWYVELTKPIFTGMDEEAKRETRATVAFIRDEILKMLHPFMPFITEELWQVTASNRDEKLLAIAQWPGQPPFFAQAHEEVGWLIELVNAVRSVRAEMNVPAGTLIALELVNPSELTLKRAERWDASFNRLARVSGTFTRKSASEGAVQLVVGSEVMALPLKGVIDLAAERARLEKEIGKADGDIKRVDAKLSNEKFVANAPEEIVEEEKEKLDAALSRKNKLQEALKRLKKAS